MIKYHILKNFVKLFSCSSVPNLRLGANPKHGRRRYLRGIRLAPGLRAPILCRQAGPLPTNRLEPMGVCSGMGGETIWSYLRGSSEVLQEPLRRGLERRTFLPGGALGFSSPQGPIRRPCGHECLSYRIGGPRNPVGRSGSRSPYNQGSRPPLPARRDRQSLSGSRPANPE